MLFAGFITLGISTIAAAVQPVIATEAQNGKTIAVDRGASDYVRPWEKDLAPAKTFTMIVQVK
jgi:hypothetical protein